MDAQKAPACSVALQVGGFSHCQAFCVLRLCHLLTIVESVKQMMKYTNARNA